MKRRPFRFPWVFVLVLGALCALLPTAASGKDIGAEPPSCPTCCICGAGNACPDSPGPALAGGGCPGVYGVPVQDSSRTGTSTSLSEGNLTEQVDITNTSGFMSLPTSFSVIYNSYNADLSRAQLDTVMGYGWTHVHNVFLFSQVGSIFRFDGAGRVTRYKLGAGGTYTAAPGYFETLVKNPDASFTLTLKDRTILTFRIIPGTPFLVVGTVYRLTQLVDRNGNVTTYTYTGGNLTSVTDTYNRSLIFTYTTYSAQNKKLATVTDPAGRVTTFQYDATGRKLTKITDPAGKTTQYTYNALYQLTSKVDKDGRTFTYAYASTKPVAVYDSGGTTSGRLSNPNNWATNATQLAMNQTRVYLPSTTNKLDGRGNVWRYEYDARAYLTRVTAPDGAQIRYTYDPATLMVSSVIDRNGNTTTYTYDSQGNRTQVVNALGHVTTYTYEPTYNMMTSMTDPRGRTTTFSYDGNGNRLQETDPLGQTRTWTYDSHGNVTSATDKNGNTTAYTYDVSGNLVQTSDPLSNSTSMTYDGVGNMTSRTDALGRTTTYQYDAMNRRTAVIDPAANTTDTQYDGHGNRTQVTDRNGNSTSYQYDLRQRLSMTTDATGTTEAYTYDGNDNRTSMTDRNTHVTAYQYDVQNRLTRTTDALGNVTTSNYDPAGNVVSQTDANAHTTTYTYDALHRRVTATDHIGGLTQTGYDTGTFAPCTLCGATPGSRQETQRTDANGRVTYYKYDALDRPVKVVRKVGSVADTITPADAVTSTAYDPVGNRVTVVEPNGNAVAYLYDSVNRQTKETNAASDVTQSTYDSVGNLVTTTAPNGNVTTMVYDSLDRRVQVTDSLGAVSTTTYDAVGNRLTHADGNGNTTSYAYDALDRLVTVTDSLGKSATSQYDGVGNLIETTDRNGDATVYAYDAVNRRVSSTDALGGVTSYQYDAAGNRTGVIDANGHATQYQYDAVNRMTRETYANGTLKTYTYDAVGNLTGRTDQIGQVTAYSYNDLYFLMGRSYPSAVNDSFTYDLSGRMLTADRGGWPVTFAYDGANRVTTTTQNSQAVMYSYDVPGRKRTLTYPGGRVIVEQTDLRRRLDTIDDALSPPPIVRYTYDAADRVVSRTYRNGTSAAYGYNGNNWVSSLDHTGVGTIASFNYAYDDEGNRTFEERTHAPTASEAYQYDALNRLIDYKVGTLVGTTVPAPATQTAYVLDPVGNWNSTTSGPPSSPVTQTRVHDTVNQLIQIDSTALIYDDKGNTRVDSRFTYVYDEENRLTQVIRNADSAIVGQYQYDALGRRVVKIAGPSVGFTTTRYFHDGARVIEERDGVGSTLATYVYGNRIDEILTMDRGVEVYYYHENALGSVVAVTDSAAAVVEQYSYDAYGAPTVTDGAGAQVALNSWGTAHSAVANPNLYTGRQFDEETGLYYYRARYFDSSKGRFLQRDPLGYVDGLNLYEYVRSNPVNRVDPSGLVTWTTTTTSSNTLAVVPLGSGGTLATTIGTLTVTGTCRCINPAAKDADKQYSLDAASVGFNINVNYWTDTTKYGVSFPGLTLAWVSAREAEHVTDFRTWATATGKPLADATETTEKPKKYATNAACVAAGQTAIATALNGSYAVANAATIATWDTSGKHTWGGPNQIP